MNNAFRSLHPALQPYADWLYEYARAQGFQPTITSVYRSSAQQRRLYDRYRAGLSQWPAAAPGTSLHEHRWAFDMVVAAGGRSAEQAELGRVWKLMGGRWGGDWNVRDDVHFEGPR